MITSIKETQYNRLPFEYYLKGIPDLTTIFDKLTSHRFEASYMQRVLGKLPHDAHAYHEELFRDFLSYAFNSSIRMDWALGLHFLKWLHRENKVTCVFKEPEEIVARSISRWINATQRDINLNTIIIRDWPLSKNDFWIMGQKSSHPFDLPKISKIKPMSQHLDTNNIVYTLTNQPIGSDLQWIIL